MSTHGVRIPGRGRGRTDLFITIDQPRPRRHPVLRFVGILAALVGLYAATHPLMVLMAALLCWLLWRAVSG